MNDSFINPVSFVPFPTRTDGSGQIERDEPAGHDTLGQGRLGGSIEVTWTAGTPAWFDPEPRGSGIKGSVRSLHETLAGSCWRVLEGGYLPTYRDQAKPLEGRWALLLISSEHDGRPLVALVSEQAPPRRCRGQCTTRPGHGRRLWVSATGPGRVDAIAGRTHRRCALGQSSSALARILWPPEEAVGD